GPLGACRVQDVRVFLQGADADVAVLEGVDALHGRGQCLDGGQAGHRAGHGRGADVVAVQPAAGAVGGVDDQIDLAVVDELDDGPLPVRPRPLGVLAHHGGVDAVALEHLGGAGGGQQLEPVGDQL